MALIWLRALNWFNIKCLTRHSNENSWFLGSENLYIKFGYFKGYMWKKMTPHIYRRRQQIMSFYSGPYAKQPKS